MQKTLLILLIVAAQAGLSGCGFHLQARAELPEQMNTTLIMATDPYSHFIRRLTILLEQNGAQVVQSPPSGAVLEILRNDVRKEILSIGDSARVREYRVRHSVSFKLLDEQGETLVGEHQLEQSRVISFDEQDILAATREEEFLREELADTLARQVLRELGIAGG